MIIFQCHHCGARVSEADEFAGLKRHCPSCEQPFLVPAATFTGKTLTCEQ